MALWRLGRLDQAATSLARLRSLMSDRVNAVDRESQRLMAEVNGLVTGHDAAEKVGPLR
jgi:hypothetical protein